MKIYDEFLKNNEIICLSLSLNDIPIEKLGKVTFDDIEKTLRRMKVNKGVEECVILQKCNCVELYAVGIGNLEKVLIDFWRLHSNNFENNLIKKINIIKGEKVLGHLLRTGCGLKSLLVGEYCILPVIKT